MEQASKSNINFTSQTKHQLDATLCRFYFCRVTLQGDPAEIKPAQRCIKLVFRLTCTTMHGSTKLKFSDAKQARTSKENCTERMQPSGTIKYADKSN